MSSKFNAFSGLPELLARGIGSDGVIFAEQLGGGDGQGEGNRVDNSKGRVCCASFNLSHVRAINMKSERQKNFANFFFWVAQDYEFSVDFQCASYFDIECWPRCN